MGEVYEARDTRLDRVVALKILPASLASTPDVRERFAREARAISQLSHPHICTLYDVGETTNPAVSPEGPVSYLVMELIEGETLADVLRRGPLPTAQALTYARQIADALDKAHRRGIVHGDLKPGNVMVTKAGIKLLDFGLATERVMPSQDNWAETPTRTMPVGNAAPVLGTLQYLAPEQLEGKPASEQTDIFACGALMYEMLTGRKAFDGSSQAAVIAAIMRQAPPSLRDSLPGVPPALDRLVASCLAKDPDERWRSAGDLARELAWLRSSELHETPLAGRRGMTAARAALLAVAALLLVLAGVLASYVAFRTAAPAPAVVRASILLPEGLRFPAGGTVGGGGRVAIAPDGRSIVFAAIDAAGNQALWLRPLEAMSASPIPGTDGAGSPFWAPDSRTIAFVAQGQLKTVDIDGGAPVTIAAPAIGATGAWNSDGTILFTPTANSPLHRVAAAGGASQPVTMLDASGGEVVHRNPFFLPDGRHFLYVAVGTPRSGDGGPPRSVRLASLDGNETPRTLIENASNAQFSSGHLLFLRDAMLLGQPFDPDTRQLSGEPRPLPDQVELVGATSAAFSVSPAGTLAYEPATGQGSQLVWFDRQGRALGTVGDPAQYGDVELSPDGRQAAVSVLDPAVNTRDLWMFDLARGIRSRFTVDRGEDVAPIWSADGAQILFASTRKGHSDLYRKATTGLAPEQPVWADSMEKYPTSWSADGRFVLYWTFDATGTALHQLTLESSPHASTFIGSPVSPGRFSPDGRWVAYFSNESGRPEVYVVPFPTTSRRWQISSQGGSFPRWRQDGREIFFVSRDNKLMAVDVRTDGGTLAVGQPRALFEARAVGPRFFYDVAPDGQRFLVNTLRDGSSASTVALVSNWIGALRRP
jgi:Tol biopolymer transport system component